MCISRTRYICLVRRQGAANTITLPPRRGYGMTLQEGEAVPEMTKTTADEQIKVLIVDDHALFRRGLEMVLENETDIDVVGEASDGHEAIEQAEQAVPDV